MKWQEWPLVPVSGEELVKWLHYDDNKLHVRRLMDLLSIYQESVSGNITVLFYSCELLKFYVISTSLHFYFSISFSQHSFDVTEQRKYNSQFVLKFCSTSSYGGAASPVGLSSSNQKIQSSLNWIDLTLHSWFYFQGIVAVAENVNLLWRREFFFSQLFNIQLEDAPCQK